MLLLAYPKDSVGIFSIVCTCKFIAIFTQLFIAQNVSGHCKKTGTDKIMKKLTLIFFGILMTVLGSCQNKPVKITFETTQKDIPTKLDSTKIYILKKSTENSDFNYSKLDDIDSHKIDTLNIKSLMPIFEPVVGKYKYYQFISTFTGQAYNVDGPPLFKEFHDILIIKTDNGNKIIDAYQYTLEWAEPPLQFDVFKNSAKNITLTDNLNIAKLKFVRTYSWSDDNKEMKESGIIKLK